MTAQLIATPQPENVTEVHELPLIRDDTVILVNTSMTERAMRELMSLPVQMFRPYDD